MDEFTLSVWLIIVISVAGGVWLVVARNGVDAKDKPATRREQDQPRNVRVRRG